MPITSRSFIVSTVAFLVIGIVALAGIVVMTFWLGERAQVYFDEVIRARDARTAAVEWRTAVQAAESSQRGYLLTGNRIYLSPYDNAKATAIQREGDVETSFVAYPEAAPSIARLKELAATKFVELDDTIALVRGGDRDAALAIVNTNDGKAVMDEANVFFSGIIAFADKHLETAVSEERANSILMRWVSLVAGAVILGVAAAAAVTVSQYVRALKQAREEVIQLASGLERRVEDRTRELATSRDRAEALLGEVNHRVANSLAMVSSLISMQANAMHSGPGYDALKEAQARVYAISLVHKRLYTSGDVTTVKLDEYLAALLDHIKTSTEFGSATPHVVYDMDPVSLPTDKAINLGVVVTEWVTNAFKYAYPGGSGDIRVRLKADTGEGIELTVEDDGIGRDPDEVARGTGLGTRIVKAMAATMGAEVDYQRRTPGTAARFKLGAIS